MQKYENFNMVGTHEAGGADLMEEHSRTQWRDMHLLVRQEALQPACLPAVRIHDSREQALHQASRAGETAALLSGLPHAVKTAVNSMLHEQHTRSHIADVVHTFHAYADRTGSYTILAPSARRFGEAVRRDVPPAYYQPPLTGLPPAGFHSYLHRSSQASQARGGPMQLLRNCPAPAAPR